MGEFRYVTLDDRHRAEILHERLHLAEIEHFKLSLEARLCGVLQIEDERQVRIKAQLAELEVQAIALGSWLRGDPE